MHVEICPYCGAPCDTFRIAHEKAVVRPQAGPRWRIVACGEWLAHQSELAQLPDPSR